MEAMAVPLKPGKADAWKAWTDELKGSGVEDVHPMDFSGPLPPAPERRL